MNKNELRPYQIEDVNKLLTRSAMGCFNEQRTGKTPTSITVMSKRNINRLLIVCPKSALYQWAEEISKWSTLEPVVITGTKQKKEKLIASYTQGAIIIGYDSLKTTSVSEGMINQILSKNIQGIIIDEAHRIKNIKSATTKAIFKCVKIPYRLALTGTPAHGKPEEIYSILHFLYPTVFKSKWKFLEEYFQIYDMRNKQGGLFKQIGKFLPEKELKLQTILNTISTQRKRKEVMTWLPDKEYIRVKLPLTTEQQRYLKELKNYYETEDVVTQGILDRLIRYRQICLAPELIGLKGKSPKMEWIQDYINDYPDRPTIIFSKFTSFIKILIKTLEKEKIGVIIGDTTPKQRNEIKKKFQKGAIKILIINIDAGKEALTLDTAEAIIFTDKYPPISDIQQAEDRFIATTRDKADKSNLIYELVMKDSYDEQLLNLLDKRASETDVLNDYKKHMKGMK